MPKEASLITQAAVTTFLELSPDAVAVVDTEGIIVNCNEQLLELTGYDQDQLDGMTVEALVPTRLRTRHASARVTYTDAPTIRPMGEGRELSLVRADGHEVAIDISLRPLPTPDGLRFAAVIRDVSAAQAMRRRVERAEAQLRGMIEAHQDGMAVMTAVRGPDGELQDMEIEFANAAAAAILNMPHSALAGLRVMDMIAEDDPGFRDYVALFADGTPVSHEREWADPVSGELIAVLEVRGALAGLDRVVVAFRDVLDKRLASDRMARMNTDLQGANDAMEEAAEFQRDFISASSHELRTPLTAMIGFAEILVERWDDMTAQARRDAAASVLRNAQRQRQLVDDLAHAAHLQSGRLTLMTESVDVDQTITEALRSVAGADVVAAPDATGLAALADEGRMIQILINLLSNALRYGRPPFAMGVTSDATSVTISMYDTGLGVPDAFVPQLFDAFAQASRGVRRRAKGTGLGLYISKSLAEAMGGDLTYRDTDDRRTEFALTLPRAV